MKFLAACVAAFMVGVLAACRLAQVLIGSIDHAGGEGDG